MHAIQDSKWGEVIVHTWGDFEPHMWECFRISLMVAETQLDVIPVEIFHSRSIGETVTEMQTQGIVVEHSPVIIQTKSEMITSIVVANRDYKKDMIKHLPIYERKSVIYNETLGSYDREFRNLDQQLQVVERNIFLDTSIESLPIMERDLGINTVASLGYDQRREQIASRNRASFEQTTEESIKNVANAYGNGEIDIRETDIIGVYEVIFSGNGIPSNLDGLKQTIRIIMPAHLGIEYTLAFNIWETNNKLTWGEAADKTWLEFIMWNGVI